MIIFEEIRCGFQWGAAKIVRLFSDNKQGSVTLAIETKKTELQIYVTKTGKIRVFDRNGQEWLPQQSPANK